MENIKMNVKDGKLTLEMDIEHRGGRSASGKTLRVASTEGNIDIPGHPTLKLGVNVYSKE